MSDNDDLRGLAAREAVAEPSPPSPAPCPWCHSRLMHPPAHLQRYAGHHPECPTQGDTRTRFLVEAIEALSAAIDSIHIRAYQDQDDGSEHRARIYGRIEALEMAIATMQGDVSALVTAVSEDMAEVRAQVGVLAECAEKEIMRMAEAERALADVGGRLRAMERSGR